VRERIFDGLDDGAIQFRLAALHDELDFFAKLF